MNKIVPYLLILVYLLLANSATAYPISWAGCGITKNAFMKEVAEAFEKKTGMKIRMSGGGSTKGIRSVSAGTKDMGGSCRLWLILPNGNIHKQEANARLIHVAWDALVPIVHNDNPIKNLSKNQIRKIFNGEIKTWDEVGWSNSGKIILCTRESNLSGVGFMARKFLFDDPTYKFKGRSLLFKSSTSLEQKVETSTRAFGITGISSAQKRNLKILSIDGISPSKNELASGKFPFFRPLFITVSKFDARPEVKKFIDFIKGPEGQKIISKQGTLNLEEGRMLISLWEKKFPELIVP